MVGMITFRKAKISDANQLEILVNSAYRGDSSKKGWTTEADLLDGLRTDAQGVVEMIETPNARIELAVEGDEILGCVYVCCGEDEVYFGMLTVNPNQQNLGTGKKLLSRVEELAKEWDKKTIRMTVISTRIELIEYYERRGYKWTGKIEPFPHNSYRAGLPKMELFFHEFSKKI